MIKYGIILPVRNGGLYIRECIHSILSQTYTDFQLLVLENCSTDGTSEWLSSLNDSRITIHPADRPLTIEENWSRIVQISKPEFITLIGHDDLLDPHYLSEMNKLISLHPQASLYMSHFRYIGSNGETIRKSKPMDEIQNASEFLAFFLCNTVDTMGTGFMMRSLDYDSIGGIPPSYPNLLFADFELLVELTAISYRATASTECFAFRLHQSATTTSTDLKFISAFDRFINYLELLKIGDSKMKDIIERYALNFIQFYCKGLSHRLLRTPKNRRQGQSVAEVIDRSKSYAERLAPGNSFEPELELSIKIAGIIDRNSVLREMFLLLRKIYSKPFYQ